MMQDHFSREQDFHRLNECCIMVVNKIYSAPEGTIDGYLQSFLQFVEENFPCFARPRALALQPPQNLRRAVLRACTRAMFRKSLDATSQTMHALQVRMKEYHDTQLPHDGFPGEIHRKRQRHSRNCY